MRANTMAPDDVKILARLAWYCERTRARLEQARDAWDDPGVADVVNRFEQRYRASADSLGRAVDIAGGRRKALTDVRNAPAGDAELSTSDADARRRSEISSAERSVAGTLNRFHDGLTCGSLSEEAQMLVAFEYVRLCTGTPGALEAAVARAA